MIKCPKCGKEFEETMEQCPDCNCPIEGKQGSKEKKKIVIAVVSIVAVISLFATLIATHVICLNHEWEDATCDAPMTCKYCGKTEGEPLEHKWVEATCTRPKVCILCHKTEGEPLEHDWLEATCTEPKKCKDCRKTEGEPLDHKPGNWEEVSKPTLAQGGLMVKYCKVCGEEVDSKYETKAIGLKGEQFNFKPLEIVDYLNSLIMNKDYEFDALNMHVEEDEDTNRYMVGFYKNDIYTDMALVINAKDLGDYCNAIAFMGNDTEAVVMSALLAQKFAPSKDIDDLTLELSYPKMQNVYGVAEVTKIKTNRNSFITFLPDLK